MRSVVPILLLLCACEPPPRVILDDTGGAPAGEPTIRVIYPPSGSELALADDCSLPMLVVVDVENLELIDPAEATSAVAGEGHWHLETGADYIPVGDEYVEASLVDIPPDTTQLFPISLQNNLHQPLGNPGSATTLEVRIVQPSSGVICP